ncbi:MULTISPECIES: hypothetical protein [unclassified Bradyrhizobium]|uniref:hypothetical protein n=1 Tax=Bradyrhizobium TaxID=374 RepID=UPI0028EA435D|nr:MULTISPECIES: hypothetical protein [unclassified Bradyrhizobium]
MRSYPVPDWLLFINDYVRRGHAYLAGLGLTFEVGSDFAVFAAAYYELSGEVVLSTYDPEHSYLTPANSFWAIARRSGHCVATAAIKLIDSHDFRYDLAVGKVFWDLAPRLAPFAEELLTPEFPFMAGKVAYCGAAFVAPELRQEGINACVGRMTRLLSIKHFGVEWLCATCFERVARSTLPLGSNAFSHIAPCIVAPAPASFPGEPFYLMWSSRDEMLERLRTHSGFGSASLLQERNHPAS